MRITDLPAIFFHPARWFKERTRIWFSHLDKSRANTIRTSHASIKKCSLRFNGQGNTIQLDECDLYNTSIFIRGTGHTLIVGKGVQLENIRIKIIGTSNCVRIGAGTTMGGGNIICGGKEIPIFVGEKCVVADGVDIWSTDTHSITQRGELINAPRPIHIGNHVWIGKDVAILKGVSVGDNAVIGMRSTVTCDIAPGSVNVGSPVRQVKEDIDWNLSNPNNA